MSALKLSGRCVFPSLHKPAEFPGDNPERRKYQLVLLVDKTDPGIDTLRTEVKRIITEKFAGKAKGLSMPITDGDDPDEKPEFKGFWVIKAKTNRAPGVVDQRNRLITDVGEIQRLIQSGDYVRISYNCFSYDVGGNKGVAVGLNNVQFVAKGEPLMTTRAAATDEFEPIETDGDEPVGAVAMSDGDEDIPF
jgi:Protein of unknown function (DUF2815)